MASQHKPKLTYFNGRGLAEVARLIFAEAGASYEVRIVRQEAGSFLVPGRPLGGDEEIKDQLLYGQVPRLEFPG